MGRPRGSKSKAPPERLLMKLTILALTAENIRLRLQTASAEEREHVEARVDDALRILTPLVSQLQNTISGQ